MRASRSPRARPRRRRWSATAISASTTSERIAAIDAEIATLKEKLAGLEAEWATEQKLVDEIDPRASAEILAAKPERQAAPTDADAHADEDARDSCAASSTRWRASIRKSA